MQKLSIDEALSPAARRLLFALLALSVTMGVLDAVTRGPGVHPIVARFFKLDSEYTPSPMVTSTLLLSGGLSALLVGTLAAWGKMWQRIFWWFVGLLLIYLCLDEYYTIHESILNSGPGTTGPWLVIYAAFGLVGLAVIIFAYLRGFREQRAPFMWFLGGLGVAAFGGLAMEGINFLLLCTRILDQLHLCHRTTAIEESIEIAGVSIILAALLSMAHRVLDPRKARLTSRIVTGAAALWLVWVVGNVWAFPALEARLLATPVHADYLHGQLSLVGYRVSRDVLRPNQRLRLDLYWRASDPLERDYFYSTHLVPRPDAAPTIAQADRPIGGWLHWNTATWFPGVVMRDTVWLTTPADLDTPASYWLTGLMWYPTISLRSGGPQFETATVLQVDAADRELLDDDTLALFSLPALDATATLPAPPTEAHYAFEDGFALTGYALPESGSLGQGLPVAFWWEGERKVDGDFVQFVHFFHSNGEDFFVFDQPPFGGRLPTSDWRPPLRARDAFQVPIPEDAPPGEYQVMTGMYALETGERRAVTGADGQPVLDNAIPLGTLILEP